MSSNFNNEIHDPVGKLIRRPVSGILKSSKSMDESRLDHSQDTMSKLNNYPTTGMTRSESKSRKIPHFDEMNIIATYHPVNKDYGHMKIEEPKTPYAHNDNIDEEMDTGLHSDETACAGFDPDALLQRLNASSGSCQSQMNRGSRGSLDENATETLEELDHRKRFEKHRKQHYNEFQIVRLRKQEIEAELHALEQEEATATGSGEKDSQTISSSSSDDSIKPILLHQHARDSTSCSHHVHVEDDHQFDVDEHLITPEEQERRKQFELKRRIHYNEFRAAHLTDQDDEK
ncbi:unnamed protein product [Rotaria magnacalcarata]|uniref:Protein phosphatase inhibitor 2 n=2 Tax=Rotaria magnacalcarata TaxID=392030 RepID=A0A816LIF3_9BILA|nr:unnamed protein product [Rotaria magnacalcarata]CAF1935301.1 unnamed protein product [Rotaria magnacalcarata]CAF1956192.1 unnamed protein product [Rotaria magnacalcarata]CAF3836348.1 unnamed protein product [Rotaria magnacalcarata]CAF4040039.1 unnamed protein product [Rotaria magnacalcarata]